MATAKAIRRRLRGHRRPEAPAATPGGRARRVQDHHARALDLLACGKLEDAVGEWRAAARLDPTDHRFPVNIGATLHSLRRDTEAAASCREAIRLNPRSAEAHANLAACLTELNGHDEAIAACREAIRLRPDRASLRRDLGAALAAAGRPAEARAVYDEILRVDPANIEVRVGLGHARLALGDHGGWRDLEARHDRPESLARQVPGVPRWRGQPLDGPLLLNASLDGFGDALQGIRFAVEARRRVGSTILLCDPALAGLLVRVAGVDRVVTDPTELPPVVAQTCVLGLAAVFGATPEAMATSGPYLEPDPETVERRRPTLAGIDGLRVGVVWQGDPRHVNDRRRSFRLADLEPLAEVPGVALVSLQRGAGADQLAGAGFPVVGLGPEFAAADLLDTAGLMQHLDLLVAADTGLVHLAGAMGKPAWVALASPAPDWRWSRDPEDSPWYPTIRLFRQERSGDWSGVFRRMADELRRIA
jgi:Flp pilus assembly protein TadD